FAFAYFQLAMLHVARGTLTDAETVLRQGAAVQDRQIGRGGRYPALGLHWLLGLVRLAQDDVHEALLEFDRESALAQPHRLYGREYQMHAWNDRGAALLRINRTGDAIDALRRAAALYPAPAQTQLALARAYDRVARASERDHAASAAASALSVLKRTRPVEAAMVRAQQQVAEAHAAAAADTLTALLAEAPAGFAGWTIPI